MNYQPVHCEGAPIAVERSTEPAVQLSGWAVDGGAGRPAAAVLLVIDGQQRIPTLYDRRRVATALPPEVAAIGHEIGFWAAFATALLDPGEHTLGLEVVSADEHSRLIGACTIRLRMSE